MANNHRPALVGALCVALTIALAAAAPARAADFTPDAATLWIARSTAMAGVWTKGVNTDTASDAERLANTDTLKANMLAACDGLQSEQVGHEYGKTPAWALSGQTRFCSAMERWAGKGFMTTKVPCHDVDEGLKDFAKAGGAGVAPEVARAAGDVETTMQMLLAAAKTKDARLRLRCSY